MSKIVFCICGSFCNHKKSLAVLEELVRDGYDVTAVVSENSAKYDTRFGTSASLLARVEGLTGNSIITDMVTAEQQITGKGFAGGVVCPCTANTLAKLRYGITDTAVSMAVKCLLRNNNPILLAIASNDALSASFENVATMRNRKNFTLVPMAPDDLEGKPNSMICDFTRVKEYTDKLFK